MHRLIHAVGSWNSEDAILASGISAAFFPHGLGHSLGLDVHDAPRASKPPPEHNPWLAPGGQSPTGGHPDLFANLRLRLPLRAGMVVVRRAPRA
jgi:Xaa-Pro dipeptidase